MQAETLQLLLQSIATGRLVIFAGAGLSMAAPSNLPGAPALARKCAARDYDNTFQCLPDELTKDLEALARHFWQLHRLENYFIPDLVDWEPFFGTPNRGHTAVADFIWSGAIDQAITTNVDALVERAAAALGAPDTWVSLDGAQAGILRPHRNYLKLHGCCRIDRLSTLWCREQIQCEPWPSRIDASGRWLAGQLTQRDIVFVGYWTDWDYLNQVLVSCLGASTPRSVVLVDPAPTRQLEAKAPDLWAWAHRPGVGFTHEPVSADEFLDELRAAFSAALLRRIANAGAAAYLASGAGALPNLDALRYLCSDDAYDLRRDWTGVPRHRPSRRSDTVTADEQTGHFVLSLLGRGATIEGSYIRANGRLLRVRNTAGRVLHSVMAESAGEPPLGGAAEITICVGAQDDGGAPTNILRAGEPGSILRPAASGIWCTDREADERIGW